MALADGAHGPGALVGGERQKSQAVRQIEPRLLTRGGCHEKLSSAFMVEVLAIWVFPKTCPLVLEPRTQPSLPYTLHTPRKVSGPSQRMILPPGCSEAS